MIIEPCSTLQDVGEGVGLGTLTFDLYYIGSRCLTTPFVYMLNYIAGNIIYAWIVVPVLHYTNAFNTPKLLNDDGSLHAVLNAPFLFNSSGYRIHAIDLYDPITFDLSLEKFNANKPIYITEYYAMDYTANFMTLSAMFSHVALFHGKEIVRQAKNAFGFTSTTTSSSSSSSSKEHSSSSSSLTFDIHNELMSHYPDIPEWGYLVYLVLCVGFLCAVVSTTSFSMPIWSVFLGVGICAAAILPIGIILAITGTTIYLTSMGQIIIGYLLPGKTIAVMAFVSLITNGASQAIILIGDLKLGHYMKVPPIAMVSCQLMGTILGSLSTLSGSWFVMTSMSDLIGKGDWQTNYYQTVYNSGAVWGAIGTDRFFGVETPYNRLLYGFIVGFLLPFVPWIGIKVYPRRFWLFINIPVILYYVGAGFFQLSFGGVTKNVRERERC